MTGIDDREKGFEKKFENDQELAFKVKSRRNHLLGLWAATQLGLAGDAAEAYAKTVMDPAQHPHGDDDIVKKLTADFQAKGVSVDAGRVRLELEQFGAQARKQLGAS